MAFSLPAMTSCFGAGGTLAECWEAGVAVGRVNAVVAATVNAQAADTGGPPAPSLPPASDPNAPSRSPGEVPVDVVGAEHKFPWSAVGVVAGVVVAGLVIRAVMKGKKGKRKRR